MRYIIAIWAAILGTALLVFMGVYFVYGIQVYGFWETTRISFFTRDALIVLPQLIFGVLFWGAAAYLVLSKIKRKQ